MRISDWSSDVCSSDLQLPLLKISPVTLLVREHWPLPRQARVPVHVPTASPISVPHRQIGRATCRERVCQYVSISVVVVPLNKHNQSQPIGDQFTTIQSPPYCHIITSQPFT